MNIPNTIKTYREFRKYKQEFMAEKLDMSQSAYSALETTGKGLTVPRLEIIAELLDVPIVQFFSSDSPTIHMSNQTGTNGYHVTQNQSALQAEAVQQMLDSFTAVLKAQQELTNRLLTIIDRQSPTLA